MKKKDSIRRLRPRGVQAVLKEPGWSLDAELTAQIPEDISPATIYKSSDGRILLIEMFEGGGSVYESVDAWLALLASLEPLRNSSPSHLLQGRLPQGQDFINQIPALINELAAQLDIPLTELDKTKASLRAIDRAIRRKGQSECLEAEIFAPLVAYVGEVGRQTASIPSHWEMREAEMVDPRAIILTKVGDHWEETRVGEAPHFEAVWEPWIVDEQGGNYPIFVFLYDELSESPRCCTYGIVDCLI
jgi:hypothetical protein